MKQIINTKIDEYKDSDPEKAKDWQNAGLLLDMLAGGLSSPGDGFLGSVAGAANPLIAQTIKEMVDSEMLEKGGLGHILAHGIAGAAMAAANGGDLLSGALTAGGAEALAPIIAEFLYGKGDNPEALTADEKNTLSAIIGILGTGTGALTGDSAIDAVIGDSVATNAVENNYVLNKIDNCKNLSSKECGRAGDLVNQIFEYNPELPSLDDLNSLLSNCESESCAVKILQEHHKEISDATLATIKEMGIQGELSREDIAFIESMVGSEMLAQLQENSGKTGGGKLWQHELLNAWTNGQELYSFLDNEYRIKELMDEGYSPEEATAKVGREEFLTTLASTLVGGGKGSKKPGNSNNKDKGKEESGKSGQALENKANQDKSGNKSPSSSVDTNNKINDFLNNSNFTSGQQTTTNLRQRDNLKGNYKDAEKDFYSLNPTNVVTRPNGTITGNLADGTNINVRPRSSDGRPTLEIQTKPPVKIRYGEKGSK